MGADEAARRLTCLTRLGHRLPLAAGVADACEEVVRALTQLEIAAAATLVEGDMAEVAAILVPEDVGRLSQSAATRMVGLRVPLDGVESLRSAVRFRRPYFGQARAVETIRSVTNDSGLTAELPTSFDEDEVIAIPVSARDRVVAVITVWGENATVELVPTVEAVAAMLASAWVRADEQAIERFGATPSAAPRDEVRAELSTLLESGRLVAALQPVSRLYDSTVIGYEALSRFPPSTNLRTPDHLFSAASEMRMETALDIACMRAALREAPSIGDVDIFMNVLIRTLLDRQGMRALHDSVRAAGVDPSLVVLEFSERDPVPDLARLQRIAAELRSNGFRIAVDDAGSGHASMRVIAELRPEFIKVDRSLIHAIDSDRARQALVVSLLSFSGNIGARLIAEGIETASENETLLSLGVQFGQGWHLGRPVLLEPVPGHTGTEVVDAAWFASRPVSRIRDAALPGVADERESDGDATTTKPRSRRRGLARALSDAALALQSEHDPLRILRVIAEQMARVVPVTEMAILAADYETHRFVPMVATGTDKDEIMADSFSLDAGLTGWAFALGTPQNFPDTATHPRARQVPNTPVVHESMLAIPLVAGDRKLGIINCWRVGVNQFSERELEAASLFAHVAASAWRNAQLYTELLSAAMTDPLTALYNSRWLRDTVGRDLVRSQRDGTTVSLLLVDLDHFKRVNDTGGHAAGDLVLQRVAARLRSSVRGADAVVRLGGEEFVILLHGCDANQAMRVADAVRCTIRESTLPDGCGLERMTASIGVAAYPEHGTTLDQLLASADRAMYEAKHAGRDRVQMGISRMATVLTLPERRRHAARN